MMNMLILHSQSSRWVAEAAWYEFELPIKFEVIAKLLPIPDDDTVVRLLIIWTTQQQKQKNKFN